MINLEDITVVRSGRTILGPVSIEVGAHEHYALLGPNGAGKSTLVAVISGQLYPTSGQANVCGVQFGFGNIRNVREQVSVISQKLVESLPPASQVIEIVLTGKRNILAPWWDTFGKGDEEAAYQALETVKCRHLAERMFGDCSQGERQRILIARSLLVEHELFLFDEPSVGLDFPAREQLLTTIDHLAESGKMLASVYIAHYLEELPENITHVILLKNGQAVISGKAEDILTNGNLTNLYGLPINVVRNDRRWSAFVAH